VQCIRGAGRRRAAAAQTVVDGGAGDGGGRRRRRSARRTNGGGEDEGLGSTKTKELFRSRAPAHIYRGRPFSTGPWLEPVLKGL
jgi:hypothetical protein